MGSRALVVLDTNVLVSALGWRGSEHRLYARCRSGDPRLAISPVLLGELRRVPSYPKFAFTEEEIERFISDILTHALMVSPPSRSLEVVERDPDDDRVLECAVEAGARWIVSGDRHLLDLARYKDIRIVDAVSALDLLKDLRGD